MAILGGLLLLQPDLVECGCFICYNFAGFVIVGANFWQFVGLGGIAFFLFLWLVASALLSFKTLYRFSLSLLKIPLGAGYQLTNLL